MKYRVIGADVETGQDVQLVVEAKSVSGAERIAQEQRVLVSNVDVVPSSSGVDCDLSASNPQVAGTNPNVILALVSFLIPVIGVILGTIFVTKLRDADKQTGKACFIASIAGAILWIGTIILILHAAAARPEKTTTISITPPSTPTGKANEETGESSRNADKSSLRALPKLRRQGTKAQIKGMRHYSRFVTDDDAYGEQNEVAAKAALVRRTDGHLGQTIQIRPREAYAQFRVLIENNRADTVFIDASSAALVLVGGYKIDVWAGEVVLDSLTENPSIIELNGRDVSTEGISSVSLKSGEYCVLDVCFRLQQGTMKTEEALSYCDSLKLSIRAMGRFDLKLEF